ncbi:hypothetical protein [Pseudoalteromonas sp. RB2-MNA-CIBAN-0110]|uniref:hypothetical protein n=1 Tax=Pseudoalteromonas sp. RB2-MNA-CIBAN-0110 TaxID=3140439 RepID=UPI003329AF09
MSLFDHVLNKKPYNTDDLEIGLAIARAQIDIKSRDIQANGPNHKYWLVFDVDKSNAS